MASRKRGQKFLCCALPATPEPPWKLGGETRRVLRLRMHQVGLPTILVRTYCGRWRYKNKITLEVALTTCPGCVWALGQETVKMLKAARVAETVAAGLRAGLGKFVGTVTGRLPRPVPNQAVGPSRGKP